MEYTTDRDQRNWSSGARRALGSLPTPCCQGQILKVGWWLIHWRAFLKSTIMTWVTRDTLVDDFSSAIRLIAWFMIWTYWDDCEPQTAQEWLVDQPFIVVVQYRNWSMLLISYLTLWPGLTIMSLQVGGEKFDIFIFHQVDAQREFKERGLAVETVPAQRSE